MTTVEPIHTADLKMPHAYVYRGELRGPTLTAPCLAFALHHPDEGTILVDTGFHRDARANLRKDFGLPMSLMFASLKPAEQPFDEQLRDMDIDPAAITQVVMTHLHVDHTSGMRLLPNAEFACDRREWRAATGKRAGGKGYVAHHLPPEDRMRLLDFDDRGEIDLFGDGSIRLLSTPGHTAGHVSVLIDGELLLVGDAAYTLRSIETQRPPLLTTSDSDYRASLERLRAHKGPKVPSHDPTAWHSLERRAVRIPAPPAAGLP